MELHKLYTRLIVLDKQALFDSKLADSEFGPFCTYLTGFKKTEIGIELVFDDEGDGVVLSKAIEILEPLVESNSNAIVFRNYNGSEYPLKRVYEDVPIFIMECDIRYEEE